MKLTIAATAASAAITTASTSSAPATTPASAVTSAATAASATMTTAVASASTASTSASAFALRTRFIHDQRAAKKILAVQRLNRLFRLRIISYFRETESTGLPRKTIPQE